jgi:cardiolipin synthase
MKILVKRLGIGCGILVVAALAFIGVLSVTRGTPVEYVISAGDLGGPPNVGEPLFAPTMELYTNTELERGNRVELLLNGDGTYPPLWRDLRSARTTITVQMYFAMPGAVADTMAAILAERARAGVRVLFLLDGFGAQTLPAHYEDRLRAAGVDVRWLRRVKWFTLHKAAERSHARVVVVDGRVGYTGGFGLADYWLGGGHAPDEWRETNVRFEGPAVAQLQAGFGATWAEASGELITGGTFFPQASFDTMGTVRAALFHAVPSTGSTAAERFLALTIASARRTLYITNAYFVPDDDFRGLLKRAAQRGVDVRVLTAGPKTDVKTTWYAGRARYEEMMDAGVKIYEYAPTMIHSKTISVDGEWGTVGSMNFDNRSMAFNNESNLLVLDRGFVARLDTMFLDDLRFSTQMTPAVMAQRTWLDRLKEKLSATLQRVL